MGNWASKQEDILDALVTRFSSSADLQGIAIRNGPEVVNPTPKEVITVGWTGTADEVDTESQFEADGFSEREFTTVRNAVGVIRGDTDVVAARKRAYQIVNLAAKSIAAEHTLGGLVMRARITSMTLQQTQTGSGAQAIVIFHVYCDAFTS